MHDYNTRYMKALNGDCLDIGQEHNEPDKTRYNLDEHLIVIADTTWPKTLRVTNL